EHAAERGACWPHRGAPGARRAAVHGRLRHRSVLAEFAAPPAARLPEDRSLFSGGSPRGQAPELVRTIVALARDMGTQVVAEGVETAEQLGFLRELGCAAAQGFYFSPPVDGAEACSLVGRS